jgi:hypothetical protein
LLRAQVRFVEELPYRLHGARQPTLSTVYVRREAHGYDPSGPGESVAEAFPEVVVAGGW